MKLIGIVLIGAVLAGCAGTSAQIGIGYRKVPRGHQPEPVLTFTPEQTREMIDILGPETFGRLFPSDERVDVGAWVDFEVR